MSSDTLDRFVLFISVMSIFCLWGVIDGCEAKKSEDCHLKTRWGYLTPVRFVSCEFTYFMNQEG